MSVAVATASDWLTQITAAVDSEENTVTAADSLVRSTAPNDWQVGGVSAYDGNL